jgi:hypothetical protein
MYLIRSVYDDVAVNDQMNNSLFLLHLLGYCLLDGFFTHYQTFVTYEV